MGRRLGRREMLLAATGLGASSLLLPSLLRGSRARADNPVRKRLVIFYSLHGTVYQNWNMRRPGLPESDPSMAATAPDWEFPFDDPDPSSFSEILRPLHEVRSDLLVLDGLSMASVLADRNPMWSSHPWGRGHSLTGTWTESTPATGSEPLGVATGPSVDQFIARNLPNRTAFPSLEYSVGRQGSDVIFSDAGVAVPPETSPLQAFKRLFPGGLSAGANDDEGLITSRQRSVLDFVKGEYEAVIPRLSLADRHRLEQYRATVRDLEVRLSAMRSAACATPAAPEDFPAGYLTTPSLYPLVVDAFTKLIAAAFTCDLTRVVSLQIGLLPTTFFGALPGDAHADFAHHSDGPNDTVGRSWMTAYHQKEATLFRSLIDALKAIPEGNGTVLDNTALVWCNELGSGGHTFSHWPVVIAGGAGGAFRTGRYLRWLPRTPSPGIDQSGESQDAFIGVPHNRLLTSLCQAMGVDVSSFGLTSVNATNGATIDLTGPLDRLT